MKKIAVLLSLVYIFIFSSGFQPPPCEMKIDGYDPFHPVFYPKNSEAGVFGVYRQGDDGTWVNKTPVWEITHPEYEPGDYLGGKCLELDTVVYGNPQVGFKETHPPEKFIPGVRYEVIVEGLRQDCSREFEIVEKDGGYELGQCPPDTTERAEQDGCLARQILFLRERLPNGDWAEPEIAPEPKHMGGGWQATTCRDYHLLKRQAPFEIEGLSFDPNEICFLDDPRIDRQAGISTRIAYDSRDAAAGLDPERLADDGYFVIFYCLASANQGKKCFCSEEDLNIPEGILDCTK